MRSWDVHMQQKAQRLEIVEELINPEAVSWSAEEVSSGVLRLRFISGPTECFAATASVDERSDTEVTIELRVGFRTDGPWQSLAIALESYVDVMLNTALEGRSVRAV